MKKVKQMKQMKKAKLRAKTLSSNVILGAVSFMTGFLVTAIVQEVSFKFKRRKENVLYDVCSTKNGIAKSTKYCKKDDNNKYFSSFDMKVGLGDV